MRYVVGGSVALSWLVLVTLDACPVHAAQAASARDARRPSAVESAKIPPSAERQKKELAQRAEAVFDRAGWKEIKAVVPDLLVVELDPKAAAASPEALLVQIRTVPYAGAMLDKLAALVRQVPNEAIRREALQAVVRSPDRKSQRVLMDLYQAKFRGAAAGSLDEEFRATILGGLRPREENDEVTQLLYAELADPRLSLQAKQKALDPLVAMSIARFGKQAKAAPPAAVANRLPPQLQQRFREKYLKLQAPPARDLSPRAKGTTGRVQPKPAPQPAPKLPADAPPPSSAEGPDVFKYSGPGQLTNLHMTGLRGRDDIQVLVLSTGYTNSQTNTFRSDVLKMIADMCNHSGGFTRTYRDRIAYVVCPLPGPALASGHAVLGAKTYDHPFREGAGLTLNNDQVIAQVDRLKRSYPYFAPIAVMVIYNYDEEATGNAVIPTLLRKPYGIARLTRRQIQNSPRVPVHELAHAGLNFLDEYVEDGFGDIDLASLDAYTPLIFERSLRGWGAAMAFKLGDLDMRISEIVADNGSGHVSMRRNPSLVTTAGYTGPTFAHRGSCFFPDVRHADGASMMHSYRSGEFDFAHNTAQNEIVNFVFRRGALVPRPNDRIRIAAPANSDLPHIAPGDVFPGIVFDADKNHRWHPTIEYELEVTWKRWGDWHTRTRTFARSEWNLDLRDSFGLSLGEFLRKLFVAFGHEQMEIGGNTINLAETTAEDLVGRLAPSLAWPLPYQVVDIPAPKELERYYWRFRTRNARYASGWTGWSSFLK